MSIQHTAGFRCAWRRETRHTSCSCTAGKLTPRGTTRRSSGPRARWRAGRDSARGLSRSRAVRRGRASRAAGAFLAAVLRRVIFLPALRYVDDFFSADDGDGVGEAAAAAAELIRILLGGDAVQARKLEWGSPLVVLGVEVQAARAVSPPRSQRSLRATRRQRGGNSGPCRRRRRSSCGLELFANTWPRIECRQERARPDARRAAPQRAAGEASKLAGRLSWGCAYMFNRLGRALLRRDAAPSVAATRRPGPRAHRHRPLFARAHSRAYKLNEPLRLALRWWLDALERDLSQARRWDQARRAACCPRAAARSAPPGRTALCRDFRRR